MTRRVVQSRRVEELLPPERTAAPASTESATSVRQHRHPRSLLDCDQGRLHLANLLLQFCSMALRGPALLASLSAFVSRPANLYRGARRENASRRIYRKGRPTGRLVASQSGHWVAHRRARLRRANRTKTADGIPVLGNSDDLERIIVERGITQIIMLEFPLFTEINRISSAFAITSVFACFIVSDLEEKLRHPVTHFEDDGFRFIGLREEPLENPLNRFFKRVIDVAISLPVMLFIFPVLTAVVWIAQRLQSPGPLFHVQTRAGMQNRQFKIYKFRTMQPDHEEVARQAHDGDERVYPTRKMVSQTEHRRGSAILERPPRRHEHRRTAAAPDRAQQSVLATDGELPRPRFCEARYHRPGAGARISGRSARTVPTSKTASPATSSTSKTGISRLSAESSCALSRIW